VTAPRRHYALPPETGPEPEPQQSLWIPNCAKCGGAGVVQLWVTGADPDDWYTCRACGGSGVEGGELAARRLRDGS
jgi:hypothetical protein